MSRISSAFTSDHFLGCGDLDCPEQITGAVALEAAGLGLYAEYGAVITDDNPLLACGQGRSLHFKYGGMSGSRRLSLELIKTIASGHPGR
ncbi:MAG: hypothetical protein HY815_23255 [Candidatus Riflebacteria bacterium]|nr:hypothetical protein [Candidatus Riflebacteria bacterium]